MLHLCGQLADPVNGSVSYSNTTYESVASYSFNPGFLVNGHERRVCQEDGTWSGNAPSCQRKGLEFNSVTVSILTLYSAVQK